MKPGGQKISRATVRADFNDPLAVVHYARAAHQLGLWESERGLIQRFFPRTDARLLEAGCGAGRDTLGLWQLGYRELTAFDFAEELLDQARSLAAEHGESARLVAAGRELGQQRVGRQTDRDGDADLALHIAGEARQHHGGRRAVQDLGAGQV